MPRLLLLTPSELRDPCARRAAATARSRGIEVVGLSGRASGKQPVPFTDAPVVRTGRKGRLRLSQEEGLPPKRNRVVRELRGMIRLARLGVRTAELWRSGQQLGSFDVVHANDLDTLPAGWLARRAKARLVGVAVTPEQEWLRGGSALLRQTCSRPSRFGSAAG